MKSIKNVFTFTFLILFLTSCANSLAIQSDFDTQYDLSSYKTYTIISPSLDEQDEMISINPILIQRISRSCLLYTSDAADEP